MSERRRVDRSRACEIQIRSFYTLSLVFSIIIGLYDPCGASPRRTDDVKRDTAILEMA